jgi:hypothetical protein
VPGEPEGAAITLHDAVDVDVGLDDHVVAGFYRYHRRGQTMLAPRLRQFDDAVARLVAIVPTDRSLLDAPFLPLDSPDGAVKVALESGGTTQPLAVEVLPVGSSDLGLLRLDPCSAPDFRRALGLDDDARCEAAIDAGELPVGRPARLHLGGRPRLALAVVDRRHVTFAPLDANHYIVRADGNRPAPELGPSGFVTLILGDGSGHRGLIRLAAWMRAEAP